MQGIDKGKTQIAMVGAVGQTLYEPGTRRPLKIWTQLVKNCDTGAADLMLGSKIMRKAEWDAEVDIGDEQFRINNPDDHGTTMVMPIQWSFLYEDTPQGRVVHDDGRPTAKMMNTSGRAQIAMMQAEQQLETVKTVRLHPKLATVTIIKAMVLVLASVALQLDPLTQRMATVALKRQGSVLPRCGFTMHNTDRLSTIDNGLFETKLDGTAQIPLTNDSSEGMYFECGDVIADASIIDVASVVKPTDNEAQEAIQSLTANEQLAVELCRAEQSNISHEPEITDPSRVRQLLKSWGGADTHQNANDNEGDVGEATGQSTKVPGPPLLCPSECGRASRMQTAGGDVADRWCCDRCMFTEGQEHSPECSGGAYEFRDVCTPARVKTTDGQSTKGSPDKNKAANMSVTGAKLPQPEKVRSSSKQPHRPPEMPAVRGAKPIKESATLEDWRSGQYTIVSWDKSILERQDIIWVVILYSGIGGFSKGLPKKYNGYHVIPAVAVEGDTEVAATHRLNHPGVPIINMTMVNHADTLQAISSIFPRSLWSKAWWHASTSCKDGSTANFGTSPNQITQYRAMGEWAIALMRKANAAVWTFENVRRIAPAFQGLPTAAVYPMHKFCKLAQTTSRFI